MICTASTQDVIITLKGRDQASGVFKNVKSQLNGLSGAGSLALNQVGTQLTSFAKDAVSSAVSAETAWGSVTAQIQNTSGTVGASTDTIKNWTSEFANSMGRGVADVRSAESALANYGLKWDEIKTAMSSVNSIAAATGQTEQQASKTVVNALAGRGTALKKLGIDISNYKDETTGAIDKTKLFADIQAKYGKSAENYSNSTAAQMQRMTNVWNSFKTSVGQGIVALVQPLLPIFTGIASAMNGWLKPLMPLVSGFIALAGGVTLAVSAYTTLRDTWNTVKALGQDLITLITRNTAENATEVAGLEAKAAAYDSVAASAEAASAAETAEASAGSGASVAGDVAGMGNVASKTESTVSDASKIGALSSEASAAGTGMQATAGGLSGIASGAMAMIVPLLEIAAVIAVMIPVVTALAAEALICLKGIEMLFNALNFGDIDNKSVEGIQKLGTALWGMANAFVAMSVVTVTSYLQNILSGFGLGLVAIASSVAQIKAVIPKINSFSSAQSISDDAINKLTKVAKGLSALSTALKSLNATSWDVGWQNFFNGISKIFGGGNEKNLENAKNQLLKAVPTINTFKDAPAIDDTAISKLEKAANGVKKISEALKSFEGINGNISWDNFFSFFKGGNLNNLQTAINQLWQAASKIRTANDMPAIPEGTGNKIQRVVWGINSITNSVKAMKNVPTVTDSSAKVTKAVSTIKKIATELNKLSGTQVNSVSNLASNITNAMKSITTALNAAKVNVTGTATAIGTNIVNGIRTGLNPVGSTIVDELNSGTNYAQGTAVSDGQTLGTKTTEGFKNNLKLAEAMKTEMDGVVSSITSAQSSVVSAAQSCASAAVSAFKTGLNQNSPGDIAKASGQEITWAAEAMNNASGGLSTAARRTAESAVKSYNTNGLNKTINQANNANANNSFKSSGAGSTGGNITYNINIGEQTFPLSNLTEKQCIQVVSKAISKNSILNTSSNTST